MTERSNIRLEPSTARRRAGSGKRWHHMMKAGWILVVLVLRSCAHPEMHTQDFISCRQRTDDVSPINPGETVNLVLAGIVDPPTGKNFLVDTNGCITVAVLGPLRISGLVPKEAEKLIEQTYIDRGFYRDIDLILTRCHPSPGPYPRKAADGLPVNGQE